LLIADCGLEKNSSILRGEDKGEGEITTLQIAVCRLSVEKNKNWIPVGIYP